MFACFTTGSYIHVFNFDGFLSLNILPEKRRKDNIRALCQALSEAIGYRILNTQLSHCRLPKKKKDKLGVSRFPHPLGWGNY